MIVPDHMDDDFTFYTGDALDILKVFDPESIDCVITSPPYHQLRDYGTGKWTGGNSDCKHLKITGGVDSNKIGSAYYGNSMNEIQVQSSVLASFIHYGKLCAKCGAIRNDQQIGLEDTQEEYIENLVKIFHEIKRILTPTGTFWLNIGDGYNKKKLKGTPWKLAFALEEDGWNICADIIWAKTNPMPESVKTRPTKSHEYIFLLTKNLNYYWNHEGASEPAKWERWGKQTSKKKAGTSLMVVERTKEEINEKFDTTRRNMRSVWTFATEAYSGAHFAVFPQELPRRAISAGCPVGGIVLDPFIGSGTTAIVAKELNRKCIGIDLDGQNLWNRLELDHAY